MKILGIDSSGMVAGVAIVQDDILVAEYSVNHKKTHSQTLLPMLDEIVKMTELNMEELDAIAVSAGPGSFTGLRIGAATAKGLGMALDKPIISVPTCHALAYNLWGSDKVICPIMDARRNQVYTGVYRFDNGKLSVIINQDALDIEELLDKLKELKEKIIFTGDGIAAFSNIIKEKMGELAEFAPAHINRQRAASVACLGAVMYADGIYECADEHKPIYLRKSQAEREREERLTKGDA